MTTNRKKVIDHYRSYREGDRATTSRANGLEFHYAKKLLDEYIIPEADVIELGCATGYYGMAYADRCARYTGVDLSPEHIAAFDERIAKEGKRNLRAVVGDATALPVFADNSFDVVLCLGPMYHLPREERTHVFAECRRIAKDGAILAFAYINAIGAYAGFCVCDEWRGQYPSATANESFLERDEACDPPGVFFLTSPEEMERDAGQHGLAVVKNRGLDFFFAQGAIDDMSDERFALYMRLADRMNESPSCAGLADHALMICKK